MVNAKIDKRANNTYNSHHFQGHHFEFTGVKFWIGRTTDLDGTCAGFEFYYFDAKKFYM